jgi:hypothetical protein
MPVKLSLVIQRRQTQTHTQSQSVSNIAPQKNGVPQQLPSLQDQSISLRRIMNAPKTGCKSCGG